MFTVKTEPFGPISETRLINTKTGENVGILTDFGASLNSLILRKDDQLLDLVEGSDNYEKLITTGLKYYKGMALFPFPNRINKGQYSFQGKKYAFTTNESENNNALHGLAYQAKFEVINTYADSEKAEVEMFYEETGKNKAYPFKVRLTVVYTLTPISGMVCKCYIENLDSKAVPVGFGWHPYLKTGNTIDTLELIIPSNKVLEVDERLIPTKKILSENPFFEKRLVEGNILDTGFMLDENEATVVTEIHDHKQKVTLKLWQKSGVKKFNYIQVFIPPHRQSIAIEPMTCAPDAFNNGLGLITLQPGEKIELEYGILVE